MDEGFWIKARRIGSKAEPAALDHATLAALLSARQASSETARAQVRAEHCRPAPPQSDPLTEILLSGPDRPGAAEAQQGCFNRAEMKRRVNKT